MPGLIGMTFTASSFLQELEQVSLENGNDISLGHAGFDIYFFKCLGGNNKQVIKNFSLSLRRN